MHILHVIVGLNVGGAESMLSRLVCSFAASPNQHHVVVSLTDDGIIGVRLREKGIKVYSLGLHSAIYIPIVFWRLVRLIKSLRPDIVQTWMYHSDFLGGLAARLAGSCRVVWNVRIAIIPHSVFSVTYWLVRVCAVFSHFIPDQIICCANSARAEHIRLGYASQKITVIPNGYNFSVFEKERGSSSQVRKSLGISEDKIVVGVVGRFDPQKDYLNFVTAASYIVAKRDDVVFLMVGRGNDWTNAKLIGWIEEFELKKNFYLVGQQLNVEYYFAAMDIFCLSSVSEGFPNVVVEAMASGLPCVVTQAGDAADILGEVDFVVPVKNAVAFSNSLLQMCSLDPVVRKKLGVCNARKVREKYEIDTVRAKYEKVYSDVLGE